LRAIMAHEARARVAASSPQAGFRTSLPTVTPVCSASGPHIRQD
jgi:hypothetical protein